MAASKNWLSSYFSRKKLSQLVVSLQAVFILLVIMQIIWKLVGKKFRVRHRQSWLDPHRTFALGHVTVNKNSPIHDYVHPDGQTQPTYEMVPAGFKSFTNLNYFAIFKKKKLNYCQKAFKTPKLTLSQYHYRTLIAWFRTEIRISQGSGLNLS